MRFPLEKSHSFRVAAVYAKSILDVLRSDLNLIGLSVIDILLGLIHMTVRTIGIARPRSTDAPITRITTAASRTGAAEELLPYLKACIANLARHVYYSDQVTDLISFILLRVKPDIDTATAESSSERDRPATMTAANSNPKASASDVASAAGRPHTQGRPTSSTGTFATEDGRQIALEIIKDIIDIAKTTQQYSAGSVVINRNRVPLGVWEGSQWLLRDPSASVREAYKSALLDWARFESDEGDEALIDFEAADCIEKLADKKKPASVHGSIGQSHRSAHPQLLMLPTNGAAGVSGERRMSSANNSSSNTTTNAEEGGGAKPRVRASDLREIIDGKRFVAPVKNSRGRSESGGAGADGGEGSLDVKALLATIKIDPGKTRNQGLSMAPPY